jgi:YHS domain-containing protein
VKELPNCGHVERAQDAGRLSRRRVSDFGRNNHTQRETPMRALIASAALGTMMLATAAFAATEGEFDNMCAMGLAMGKEVKTDCSINAEIDGKTYCFGSEDAKAEFMKNPQGNLAKAQAHTMHGEKMMDSEKSNKM